MMRYLTAGESHGPCLTGIVEGLPAGMKISSAQINRDLKRRQSGYGRGGRMKIENDQVEILSGLRFNLTTGSPLALKIDNRDWANWKDMMAPEGEEPAQLKRLNSPRPGHADLAGGLKFAHSDLRLVLERSSARETAMRVAIGSLAKTLLSHFEVQIYSHVVRIGEEVSQLTPGELINRIDMIEQSPLRCGNREAELKMIAAIDKAKVEGDSLGGIIELVVTGLPPGLGSYVHWDLRLDSRLAAVVLSVQGMKGVEFGAGFQSAGINGSALHDQIVYKKGAGVIRTTNNAGGLEGGMTNGENLIVRAAMKPIPTLARPLSSVNWDNAEPREAEVERSDVCAVPAAAVVLESVLCWELAVAFKQKFAADSMDEMANAYKYYLEKVNTRLKR